MPPLSIKRKDPLVKAVRRNATRQLDAVIAALTGPEPADPALARRELVRLQSLLHLVRRPLTGEVFNREHRIVLRSLRQLAVAEPSPADTLRKLAAAEPAIEADDLIKSLGEAESPAPKRRKKAKAGPDPKQLRLVADLAEVRMRARYWHLPDGGFELLAPGLRLSYQQAAKLFAADAAPAELAELAAALARLGDQLQALERAWPDLFTLTRKSLRTLERHTLNRVELLALRPHVENHDALRQRLNDHLARHAEAAGPLGTRLFVETPPAFTKRVGAIWDAWRGSDA